MNFTLCGYVSWSTSLSSLRCRTVCVLRLRPAVVLHYFTYGTQDPISRRVVRRRSSYTTIPLSFFEVRPILAIIQFYGFLLASLIQGHIKASHPLISDV